MTSMFSSVRSFGVGGAPTSTSSAGSASSSSGGIAELGESVRNILPGAITGEENDSCFPSLSYQQRLYGFIACFITGWICTIFSTISLGLGSNIVGFVIFYTLGNVVSLGGSMFLVGPARQCMQMWKPVRAVATAIFLGSLIATLCVAIILQNVGLTLICIAIQFCAAVWYSASYIPFARKAIVNCCQSTLGLKG